MVAEWDDDRTLDEAIAAFESLTDETRQAVVEELFDVTYGEEAGATFTELRRAVGVDDPGRFHYHVDKLAETFLARWDDEYWPRYGSLLAAVSFAACHRSPSLSARRNPDGGHWWNATTRYTCPHCDRFLIATYEDREVLSLYCREHGAVFGQHLPPGLTDPDPQVWVDAAVRRQHHDAEELRAGCCPWCRGTVERGLRYGRPSYSFDSDGTVPWTPLWTQHRCRDCLFESWLPVGAYLSALPAVRRFFHGEGVDVRAEPCPGRYVADRSATESDGPQLAGVSVTYRIGDATLSVSVGSDLHLEGEPRTESITGVDEAREAVGGADAERGPADAAAGSEIGTRRATGDDERFAYDPVYTFRAQPLVTDDLVCVVAETGDLHALARETGVRRWTVDLAGSVRSPAVADGTLYVGDLDGTVRAIDLGSGAERWSTTVDGRPVLTPAAVDDRVYLGVQEEGLVVLNAADGEHLWTEPLGPRGAWQSGPVVVDGVASVGGYEGLHAVDLGDRETLWTTDLDGPPRDSSVSDGTVYVEALHDVHAFDAGSGERRWHVEPDGRAEGVAVADGRVYFSHGSVLTCVDAATGDPRWDVDAGESATLCRPAVHDGTAYVVDWRGRLLAVDAATGERRWETRPTPPHRIRTRPAVHDGAVYLGNFDGAVASMDVEDGATRWRSDVRGGIRDDRSD